MHMVTPPVVDFGGQFMISIKYIWWPNGIWVGSSTTDFPSILLIPCLYPYVSIREIVSILVITAHVNWYFFSVCMCTYTSIDLDNLRINPHKISLGTCLNMLLQLFTRIWIIILGIRTHAIVQLLTELLPHLRSITSSSVLKELDGVHRVYNRELTIFYSKCGIHFRASDQFRETTTSYLPLRSSKCVFHHYWTLEVRAHQLLYWQVHGVIKWQSFISTLPFSSKKSSNRSFFCRSVSASSIKSKPSYFCLLSELTHLQRDMKGTLTKVSYDHCSSYPSWTMHEFTFWYS